ncbi:serine/threonine protein kinase [Citrobacter sp. wls619]|uniref:serine/threonine protein kinase n=1 Tax=Citrobacter sp. wls619 TaxID=2576432 RepID=UPI002016B43A|nr:serine/threonine protein kinase [Citrobacter sp. wls619]
MNKKITIQLSDILDRPFTFTRRPDLLPCEMRPLWKCSLILLSIHLACRAGSCSLKKIHVINWIIKSEKNSSEFEFWILNQHGIKPEVRLDPTLDRALALLIADGMISKNEDKFTINDKGLEVSKKLTLINAFELEKIVLLKFKKSLTDANVNKIFQVR